jgi:hypothetical protein
LGRTSRLGPCRATTARLHNGGDFMPIWRAKDGAPIKVRAWFGNHGTGVLRLTMGATDVGSNGGHGDLQIALPDPDPDFLGLILFAIAGSVDSSAVPLYLEVSQNGVVLPTDGEANRRPGSNPPAFEAVRLPPDAPFNDLTPYPFQVAFA